MSILSLVLAATGLLAAPLPCERLGVRQTSQDAASDANSFAVAPIHPCGWIPSSEVAAVAGPMGGAPHAMYKPTRRGQEEVGCLYPLAEAPAGIIVRVDLDMQDGRQLVGSAAAKHAGWDYVDPGPGYPLGSHRVFAGRVGHVGVFVAAHGFAPHPSMLAAIGARVRDRIADLPFLHPHSTPGAQPQPGPDPCALLTRAEAEAVLGTLVVAPYRSMYPGPLADPAGESCTYFTPGHKALVLQPTWSDGIRALSTWRGTTPLPDPPDGSWDDARIGATGWLVFLKEDRLLQISINRSSTDAPGAIRLARTALGRLSFQDPTTAAVGTQELSPRDQQRRAFPQLDGRVLLGFALLPAFALLLRLLLMGRGPRSARRLRELYPSAPAAPGARWTYKRVVFGNGPRMTWVRLTADHAYVHVSVAGPLSTFRGFSVPLSRRFRRSRAVPTDAAGARCGQAELRPRSEPARHRVASCLQTAG